jgi:hypothetical protein
MIKKQEPLQAGFQVSFAQLRKPVNILVWCKDEYAITTMDNQSVLKRMVDVEQENGTKIRLLKEKGKYIAIQKYKGMNKEDILNKIKKELKDGSGGNFREQ